MVIKTRDDLMRVSRGYWEARAVLTAVELGVFEALGGALRSARVLARRLEADARALELLLDALCGMGLLAKTGTAYGIRGAMRNLLGDGPASALPMLRHHARLWPRWDGLTQVVRDGDHPTPEGGFRGNAADARAFTQAMRAGAQRLAPLVADEVSFEGARLLLDLGGGPGTYAAAFARANPGLRAVIVDLPHVCRAGRPMVAEETDVADRITYHAADFDHDPLPPGADAAFLSHVIHSQTEAEVKALFVRIRRALAPRGTLVVRDFFTTPDRTQPASASLFSLNMLVNATGGRSYSARETTAWLRRAGFTSVRTRRSAAIPDTAYVIARTPGPRA